MRFGVLGVGTIGSAVVEGLCRPDAEAEAPPVLLSPRGAVRAAALASAYASVRIAADNQGVLDACDVVFLAVRPPAVEEVLAGLRFRADHRVLSLVASARWEDLIGRIGPATSLARLLPMPPCARGRGAVLAYRVAADLVAPLRGLGTMTAVETEAQLNALIAVTGLTAPLFDLMGDLASWAGGHGVPSPVAERYVASMIEAMCADRLDAGSAPFSAHATAAVTPGGLNDACRAHVESVGGRASFLSALRKISARLDLAES